MYKNYYKISRIHF